VVKTPRNDRASVRDHVLCFKVTVAERDLIERLRARRADEVARLAGQRLLVTAGAYLRWLVEQDAERQGVAVEGDGAPP
jgi:hypothetical protein